jgi:dTDP-4-amino-4,6-dideoxygalactose transaminase
VIPFVDLKLQHAAIRGEIDAAIRGVIDRCEFTLGSDVAAFEEEFAAYCSTAYGVAVNTGTSALHLALLAAGVGPGDEVITVPFTFVATVSAIDYTGARPVFVDIDPRTYTMDPYALESAITPRTKAIVPVHLYGQAADMDPILAVARRHGLAVIEDACQAHGALYKGQRVGSLGDMGCFSFYPGKNLGACGEGGMVTTDDPAHRRKLRMLRDWGAETKYQHVLRGFNYRMEGIQGAVLRVKLRRLEAWTEARRARAQQYDSLLVNSGVVTPEVRADARHVYHLYVVRSPDRSAWQRALADQGIATGIHYPAPVHLLPAFAGLGHRRGDFPYSERASDQVLSLPMFAELGETQCARVAAAVRNLAATPMAEAALSA